MAAEADVKQKFYYQHQLSFANHRMMHRRYPHDDVAISVVVCNGDTKKVKEEPSNVIDETLNDEDTRKIKIRPIPSLWPVQQIRKNNASTPNKRVDMAVADKSSSSQEVSLKCSNSGKNKSVATPSSNLAKCNTLLA
ncbi:unnamed protein product, partial [Meganyctiphanes norvegica]